jgi:DNA-binding MarR family transcriptional regulator
MSEIDVREIAQCSCLRLRRIARRITHIYDRLLEPAGLTVNQFGLLGRLYGASQRGELLAIGTLAERVGMDPTTLNRSLKPLEKAGLIANTGDPDDRRVRAVTITDAGKDKLRAAMPHWRRAQTQIDISLGLDATVALNGLLELSYQKLGQTLPG